jgi:thioredoxin 2
MQGDGADVREGAAELEPKIRLLKLNADEAGEIVARFAVRSIPTMLLIQSGRVLARTAGAMNAEQIVAWTNAILAQAVPT